MSLPREQYVSRLVFASTEADHQTRYTQDFPFQSNVWTQIARAPSPSSLDILLTPSTRTGVPPLVAALNTLRLFPGRDARLGVAESHVVVTSSIDAIFSLLPLTEWWRRNYFDRLSLDYLHRALRFERESKTYGHALYVAVRELESNPHGFRVLANEIASEVAGDVKKRTQDEKPSRPRAVASLNLPSLVGAILLGAALGMLDEILNDKRGGRAIGLRLAQRLKDLVGQIIGTTLRIDQHPEVFPDGEGLIWSVTINRPAHHSIFVGRRTVKADAALRVFEIDTSKICWAVLDSGIDARHPAFLGASKEVLKPGSGKNSDMDSTFLAELSRLMTSRDFGI
jgi:hypothetical protein